MIEDIKAIGEVIQNLGDAGMTAFVVWIVADLLKTALVYGLGFGALAMVVGRVRDGIVSGIKASKEDR